MKIFTTITLLTLVSALTYAQSYNKKLILQLDTILKTDQQYRSIKATSAHEDDLNMHKQGVIDIINLAKIEKMIAQYGYPGKSLVGVKHQSTAFLVIQHNDAATQEKYFSLLKEAVDKGELKESSLAILTDRIQLNRGEKQTYGSQLKETKDGVKIWPIEDEYNVNIRRAKAGLQPLELYYKTWNLKYKVPTPANPNPSAMYYTRENTEKSSVEAIGGDVAIFKNLNYPQTAREANITGNVLVEYTVDTLGNTTQIAIVKGLGYGCDEEAMRVIKQAKYLNNTHEEHSIRMNLPFPYKAN